jgi:hypothetical protein
VAKYSLQPQELSSFCGSWYENADWLLLIFSQPPLNLINHLHYLHYAYVKVNIGGWNVDTDKRMGTCLAVRQFAYGPLFSAPIRSYVFRPQCQTEPGIKTAIRGGGTPRKSS